MTQINEGGGGAKFSKLRRLFWGGVIQNTILFDMGEGGVKKGQKKSDVFYGRPLDRNLKTQLIQKKFSREKCHSNLGKIASY